MGFGGVMFSLAWPRIRSRLPARPNLMMVGSFRAVGQGKMFAQSGSWQSISPSQSLSIMSLQAPVLFSGPVGTHWVVVVVLDTTVVVVELLLVVELVLVDVVVVQTMWRWSQVPSPSQPAVVQVS